MNIFFYIFFMANIAVLGATGNVGRTCVDLLLKSGFGSSDNITLAASARSAGHIMVFENQVFKIYDAAMLDFSKIDLCILNTEADVALLYVPKILKAGSYIIDSSSAYRLHPDVPLIVPSVNNNLVQKGTQLYAHANCVVCPLATVLGPLHNAFGIDDVHAVTYQSVSGAGFQAMQSCLEETRLNLMGQKSYTSCFPRKIAFNVIPQIGDIGLDGTTAEEEKIAAELKKIISQSIKVSATCVRVPVQIGHSVALTFTLKTPCDEVEMASILKQKKNIQWCGQGYMTPVEIVGTNDVYVGRVRRDLVRDNGWMMWLCSDNLRRGAAVDAVEIAACIMPFISS